MSEKFELLPSNYEKLNLVKMGCDVPLTKREIKEPFLNKSFFYIIVGPPASGKSTFLFQMLTTRGKDKIYYRVFKNILYACPPNSRGTVSNNPLNDLESEMIFDKLSEDVRLRVIANKEQYDKTPDKNYNQLLIIDDCTASLKNNDVQKMLEELAFNRRHLKLSIILLTQYLVSIPACIRSQVSCAIVFKPANDKDLIKLKEEFVNMSSEDFRLLCKFVFENKHQYLFINRENNALYKNLRRIILKNNI